MSDTTFLKGTEVTKEWLNEINDFYHTLFAASTTAAAARTALDVPSNSEAILDTLVTTTGDMIYASSAATPARLAIGTARQQLATNAGATAPEWVASLQSLMTTTGDIVQASSANTPARLAIGAAGSVLAVNAGATAVAYQAMATQADQETGTSVIAPVTPGRQQFHPSAAKAWVVFGWVATVPTVIGSYNLTSLTDEGVGDVTFVFATDFSGATYSWALGGSTVTTDIRWAWNSGAAPAAGSFRASYTNTSQANVDGTWASAVFYGDQ